MLPFSDITTEWFTGAFGKPTPVQEAAWPQIAAGRDALVSAPTGTGKTLSAFLVFIDRLSELARRGELKPELYVVYISPLRSLAADIRENLRKPLDGVSRLEIQRGRSGAGSVHESIRHGDIIYDPDVGGDKAAGGSISGGGGDNSYFVGFSDRGEKTAGRKLPGRKPRSEKRSYDGFSRSDDFPGAAQISIGVRTGDTVASDRRAMFKNPPPILITTPESLYILLTSLSGIRMLRTAGAVIVDELHALIDTKRGAHLILSLARLDALHGTPLQRIGLSATIEPPGAAAEYLSANGARVIAPKSDKAIELTVKSAMPESGVLPQGTIWPEIAREVYKTCDGTRCVIAFVESRTHAERLAYQVNLIAGDGFALTHHGSVSKERRVQAEQALREGKLRLLCATSSMELGIDVGDIDRVIQIGCPRTVSSTLQRLGRAGHNPGRVSVMRIFPRTPAEGLMCGVTAELARNGVIEPANPPKYCLDVLAQHLVSMAAVGEYEIDDVLKVTARAYPFAKVTAEQVRKLLEMLAGDFEHGLEIPARPRLLYDRINGRVRGDPYSRLLALSAGGTIPDRGLFAVRGENGVRYGEVDEEFVFEARVGDKFLLGAFAWRILSIGRDEVVVTQSGVEGVQPPFWKGEIGGRALYTGLSYGKLMRALSDAAIAVKDDMEADGARAWDKNRPPDLLDLELRKLGLDKMASDGAKDIILRQVEATGALPDDKTIIVEHFQNEVAENQLVIHSIFGRKINSPLALLARESARHMLGADVGVYDDDDGILLFPVGGKALPDNLLYTIDPAAAKRVLEALLPSTPLFSMSFRYNAARAMMMGVRKRGRQPLWIQRQKGAKLLDQYIAEKDHPLIWETKRECVENYWDVPGLETILNGIRSGAIAVREVYTYRPSPLSLPLRRAVESELMYDYTPTSPRVGELTRAAVETVIAEGRAITPGQEELDAAGRRERKFADEHQLHALLMTEGDQLAGEAEAPIEWFEELAREGRALYIEPGLWIAAEHAGEYKTAFEGIYNFDWMNAGDGVRGAGGGFSDNDALSPSKGYIDNDALSSSKGYSDNDALSPGGLLDNDGIIGAGSISASGGLRDDAISVDGAREHIVRRALRYHGGHTQSQIADRYGWPDAVAGAALDNLIANGGIVCDGDIYYHSEVYEFARRKTILARRAVIHTQPPERYAALLAERAARAGRDSGTPVERVLSTLHSLRGQRYPAAVWESVLFPWRISGYRPELLDNALTRGEYFWHIENDMTLAFYAVDDMNWDSVEIIDSADETGGAVTIDPAGKTGRAEIIDPIGKTGSADITSGARAASKSWFEAPTAPEKDLISQNIGAAAPDADETIILGALQKRGALFTQGLTAALGGKSPYDALLSLVGKGLVRSDGFMPVRQLLERDKLQGASVRQRARARAQMLTSGRWELARGAGRPPMEEQLVRAFENALILCRETAAGLPWLKALEILRVWEYTGQVRRGYYVEGLSGAQFVREEDFAYVTAALARTDSPMVWLPAQDPAQPWGKSLPHMPGRAFMNLPGSVVCLRGGLPIMVFERQGQTLRVLGEVLETGAPAEAPVGYSEHETPIEALIEALKNFVSLYTRRRLYSSRRNLTVKNYPPEMEGALISAGFTRYIQDYVLYRK